MIRLSVRSVRLWFASAMALVLLAAVALMGGLASGPAAAAQATVDLGAATPYAVLGAQTVTNTGSSVLTGDLGLYPGSSITGFPPGTFTGTEDISDSTAIDAQGAVTTAANAAASATPTNPGVNYSELGGRTLTPGVYNATSSMDLTGTVTLSGNGVYIFQAGSTLISASDADVLLEGAQAGCVFWQVASSATLGTGTTFNGTIIAADSVTLNTGANVVGRVLAQTAAVTLDDNIISVPTSCVLPAGVTSTTTTGLVSNATGVAPTGTEVAGASFHDTSTVTGASGTATGTVTYSFFDNDTCVGTPATIQAPVTIAVDGAVPGSTSTGPLAAGSYAFEATYSGDTTYAGGTSACEPFAVLVTAIPPTTPPVTTPPVTTPPVTTTPPVMPPVTTPPVTTPPVATSPVITPGAPTTTSGSSSPSTGTTSATTASPSIVLPTGGAQTGLGGAARSGDNPLLVGLGAAALLGAVAATGLGLRRRRLVVASTHTHLEDE